MNIVLASHNSGKITEFQQLLAPLTITVTPQASYHVPDIAETGLTFVENAIIKARHAAKLTGLPALADDSGLAVDALQGAPGIYSARYAGEKATSSACIEKLLQALSDIPPEKRHAAFHCVLVFMTHADDPTPLICHGTWQGTITQSPTGGGGFGYDPVFYVASHGITAAELPAGVKNQLSHRGKACHQLLQQLPAKLENL